MGLSLAGASGSNYTTPLLTSAYSNVMAVARNGNGSVTNTAAITVTSNMIPIALTGFNRDIVIENTAAAPPYGAYALEYNPGEGTCFYQQGLPGTTYGLPASGSFVSVLDSVTLFQFQPYTSNNALVLSSETGISTGNLVLVTPTAYQSISLIANSGSASPNSTGALVVQFADGSSFTTNYNAADWFFNPGFALQGVDRININSGGAQGGPNDPRFYQTTLNLSSLLGAANMPIRSLSFSQAPGSGATAVFAVSGAAGPQTNVFTLAVVTNLPATGIDATTATLKGQVLTNGGYVPSVTIFYGPINGGTNPANWSNSVALGDQNGAFSQVVTGLTANSTYYFAARAQNYAGASWATPSRSFVTAAAALPQVANAPATGIAATFATLNGQVTSSGGLPTGVILYYGPSDGGTNPASWAKSIVLGPQTGTYQQTASALTANTAYFFTAAVTNAAGTGWASSFTIFHDSSDEPGFERRGCIDLSQ